MLLEQTALSTQTLKSSLMNQNSSPNLGFTPLNTFEGDVLGISPINPGPINPDL